MLPSLNSLRAFEAAARHRSFTLAAEEIGVSQPAISSQIRNLEDFLGAQLFVRSAHALELTPVGQVLFGDLSRGLELLRRAVAAARTEIAGMPLGILLKPHFGMKWLAPRLPQFTEAHPNLKLRFVHSNEAADLSDIQIHLSVEFRRFDEIDPDCILLLDGNLTPACSPRLLEGDGAITQPGDLARHTLLHESRERTWPEWLAAAGVPGLAPANSEFYDDTNVRQEAAIRGEGVALVCPSLVADDIAARRLVCPLDLSLDTHAYYLRVSPQRRALPNVRVFVDWLLQQSERASK